jgi:hypothetical protein
MPPWNQEDSKTNDLELPVGSVLFHPRKLIAFVIGNASNRSFNIHGFYASVVLSCHGAVYLSLQGR